MYSSPFSNYGLKTLVIYRFSWFPNFKLVEIFRESQLVLPLLLIVSEIVYSNVSVPSRHKKNTTQNILYSFNSKFVNKLYPILHYVFLFFTCVYSLSSFGKYKIKPVVFQTRIESSSGLNLIWFRRNTTGSYMSDGQTESCSFQISSEFGGRNL